MYNTVCRHYLSKRFYAFQLVIRYFCLPILSCQLQTGDLPAIRAISGHDDDQQETRARESSFNDVRRMVPYINM